MKTAALPIAYLIWCRHKTGFIASACGLAAIAIAYPVLFTLARGPAAVIASVIPLVAIVSYVLNSCVFSEEQGSVDSGYPRSLFVLPAPTGALAFWPMFYGSTMAALLWIVTAGLIYPLSGFRPPVWLPALALASGVGWVQGVAWMPLAARSLRGILAAASTLALGAIPVWLIQTGRGTSLVLVSLFSAYLGAAFLVGLASVATDRSGGSWLRKPSSRRVGLRPAAPETVPSYPPFRSTAAAQLWYEWKCHGRVLPGYVGTPFVLIWMLLLFRPGSPFAPLHLALILGLLAAIPALLAGAIGPAMGRFRPFWVRQRGFITFMAVRPITSWKLLVAKFRMAVASVIVTVAIALLGTFLWTIVSNNGSLAAGLGRDLAARYPGGRSFAILALAAVLMPVLVARQFTAGFANVLTGRRWIADASAWIFLAGLLILCSAGAWLANRPEALPRLYAIIPWFVAGVAMIKGTLAIVLFRAVLRRRLIGWPDILVILGVWLAITVLGFALAILVSPANGLPAPLPLLFVGIATLVPLLRFPLGTLALEWNRHR